jgi:hypothetical protein
VGSKACRFILERRQAGVEGESLGVDIAFQANSCTKLADESANVARPTTITAIQNGVMIFDNIEFEGGTFDSSPAKHTAHAAWLLLRLQDHGDPVKFLNFWICKLHPMSFTMPEKKPADETKSAKGG